jgi:hypothetical protein
MRSISFHIRRQAAYLCLGWLMFIMAGFVQAENCFGQEAAISDFTVANSENQLLLYLTVTDWLTEEMKTAIHNGIPLTFAFYIDLSIKKNNWPDQKIRGYEFNHILEYNNLKKEYIVYRDENSENKTTSSLSEAQKLMSEINGFKILPLRELEPQTLYTVRAKAKMTRKSMPQYFHYLIPFSSPWEFETKWYELSLKLAL